MHILVVLPRFPFPTDKGDKLRVYHQLRYLSKRHKVDLLCSNFGSVNDSDLSHMKSICNEVQVFKQSFFQVGIQLLLSLLNGTPIQVAMFSNKKLKNKVISSVSSTAYDLVYAQLIRSIKNLPNNLKAPLYVDYMDCFSFGMQKRAENSTSFFEQWFFKRESLLLKKYEQRVMLKSSCASMISNQDVLRSGLAPNLFDIIPNGVSTPTTQEKLAQPIDLVFVGNMGYFPNVKAACFIVEEIMPLVWQKNKDVRIHIVGKSPKPTVLALANERVIITGEVKDIYPYLCSAKVFVAPMFTGQGLQNKVLEALNVGLPVITTSNTAKALSNFEVSGIELADNSKEFAEKILMLLKDSNKRNVLSEQGVSFVNSHYRWRNVNAFLEKRLTEVVEK